MKKILYLTSGCRFFAVVLMVFIPFGADAQSLLWKIGTKDQDSSSYIYGTIHIKDKRVFQFDKKVYEVLEGCTAFAMEVELNPDNIAGLAQRVMLPEGKTLHDIFNPDEYGLIKNVMEKEIGMEMSQFDRLKPFALLSIALNSQVSSEMEVTIDEFFYHEALKDGKKIIGLETFEEQIEILEKIPDEYIADYFKSFNKAKEDLDEIIRYYCRADLDNLLNLMQKDKTMVTLEKQLITIRNKRMADRIIPLITSQPTFIAIGAGHLPGEKGILRLLEKRGYTVAPVVMKSFDCIP